MGQQEHQANEVEMRMNIPATLKNCKQTASEVPIDLKIMDRGQSSTGTKQFIL